MGVNHVDELKKSRAGLDQYYLKTIHHEFVHIVNQTKDYPRDFDKITPNGYVNDAWSSAERREGYLQRGFITDYSQKESREDFAEMVSTYIVSTPEKWEAMMKQAEGTDKSGREAIEKKLAICKLYYKENFGIDLDKVRDAVIERENDVVNGAYDLRSLN